MSRVSVVLTLFLVCCTTIYGAVDESLCEWHYKCEDVLQSDPFICGRFAEYPVKVCPTAVTLPDVQKDGSAIEATTAEPSANDTACETTYECCKLAIPRRYLSRTMGLRSRRLGQRYRLRKGDQSWRRGSSCLKWCAVERHDCSSDVLPTPFEPPTDESASPSDTDTLHGVEETVTGDAEDGDEVTPVPELQEGGDEEAETTPETVTEPIDGNTVDVDTDVEIIDSSTDGPFKMESRTIIKVPCNGKAKPDHRGICRSIW